MTKKIRALSAAITLLAGGVVAANANETRNLELNNFDKVETRTGLDVSVVQEQGYSVKVTVDDPDLFEKLNIRTQGNTLIVERKDQSWFKSLFSWTDNLNDRVQIRVGTPELVEASSSSGSDLFVDGFKSPSLILSSSSGGDLKATDLDVSNLTLKSSSGSDLEASGHCTELEAKSSSGANINASSLLCENVVLKASSGADIDVTVTGTLDASASSGGSITVSGNPNIKDIDERSGGDVRFAD